MNWIIKNGTINDIDELHELISSPQLTWTIKVGDEYMDVEGTTHSLSIHNKIMNIVDWEHLYNTLVDRMISCGCFYIILPNTTNILFETVEKLSSLTKQYQNCKIFLILYTSCIAPLHGILPYCRIFNGNRIDTSHDDIFREIIKKYTIGAPIYDSIVYNHIYRFMEIVYEEYMHLGVKESTIVECIIDCLVGIRTGKNNKSFVHIQHLFNRLSYELSCLPQVS